MKRSRVLTSVGLMTLWSAAIAGPASAQAPGGDAFQAQARAQVLDLNVLGQRALLGSSGASGQLLPPAPPGASASSAAVLLPGAPLGGAGSVNANVTGSGTDSKPEACGATLPAPLNTVAGLSGACSGPVTASINAGNPQSSSQSTIASIEALPDPPTVTGLNFESLAQQLAQGAGVDPGLVKTQQLSDPLVAATLGRSNSAVTSDGNTITSQAIAPGGTVTLLSGVLTEGALVTITVSEARARATCNRATSQLTPTPTFNIARVQSPGLIVDVLGTPVTIIPPIDVTVAPGGPSQTILGGLPAVGDVLKTDITALGGGVRPGPNGTQEAFASGVRIHALQGVNGGVLLDIAGAQAGIGCARPTPVAVRADEVAPLGELPRTGGIPWLPVAGVGVLGLAVLVRRVAVRAR